MPRAKKIMLKAADGSGPDPESGVQLNIEPISREGASEKVVHRLLALVKTGDLKPGERVVTEGASAVRGAAANPDAFGHGHAH